jgi:hypothetical protein
MKSCFRAAAAAICLAALTALILVLVQPKLDPAKIQTLPLIAGAWLVFAVAVFLLRKTTVQLAVPLILIGAFAVQIAAISAPPANSTDLFRYIWDGRVQAAGIDPYAYTPSDQALVSLRNEFLWQPTHVDHYGDCVVTVPNPSDLAHQQTAGCTKINRAWVPTIYPPVAEAYFLGVQLVAPSDTSTTPIQAAGAACAIAITLILLFGLAKLGKDIRLAALWAWCPTVALEAGNNAHVDVLAVMFTALALLILARTRTRKRTVLGGVVLGLAIATKVTPVLVVPGLLRRRRWFLLGASAMTAVVTVYIPHVIAVGSRVIGYLPGYLNEEGYDSGSRFGLLDLVFKDKPASAMAVLVLAATAYLVLRHGDPDQPWHGAMIMTGVALAVTTPLYQWYALLLVMLVALDGQWEWLGFAAGAYVFADPPTGPLALPNPQALGYGLGLALALAGVFVRYRSRSTRRLSLPLRLPLTPLTSRPAGSAPSTPMAPMVQPETSMPSDSTPSPSPEPADTYARLPAGA